MKNIKKRERRIRGRRRKGGEMKRQKIFLYLLELTEYRREQEDRRTGGGQVRANEKVEDNWSICSAT